MTYTQAKEYIDELKPRGIIPGLTSISKLLKELDDPQDSLDIIHIAGTNGKGSTGAFLESIFMHAGKNVCRFISPAVGDHLETFTLNGEPVAESDYAKAAEKVIPAIEKLEKEGICITSFEAETAVAFLMFTQFSPAISIIECGMGGKLDSTNVIKTPLASVITSISLDHTTFLGNSLSEIAENKAGIIKNNSIVISAAQPSEAAEVIRDVALKQNAALHIADDISDVVYDKDKTTFAFEGSTYTTTLSGAFQPQNASLAIKTASVLGIDPQHICAGIAKASWPYRFEHIGKFILDGAHNEGAAKMLAQSLAVYTTPADTAFICGCFRDKDYKTIAHTMAPYAKKIYCVTPPTERGLDSSILCNEFEHEGLMAYDAKSIPNAICAALSEGHKNIVIFGSLSILKEAKDTIKKLCPDMSRVNKLYDHPIYKKHMQIIAEAEKDRRFCLHNLSHSLDVARIGRVMILQEDLDIDIELFYAAALLHDAGRYSGIPHNESGAMLAGKLMPWCGFSAQETEIVTKAILEHRINETSSEFSRVLYTADKKSRMCFACPAADECYWEDSKRNKKIDI